jgi:hypothetical protein
MPGGRPLRRNAASAQQIERSKRMPKARMRISSTEASIPRFNTKPRSSARFGAPHASRLDEGLSFLVCWLLKCPVPRSKTGDLMMKNALTIVAAVAAAMFAQGAFAQASAPTRAEVKAETKAAEKAGKLTPAGEGPTAAAPAASSAKTRAERKAETGAARKEGALSKAGDNPDAAKAEKPIKSTKTRAERKAETKAAVKEGKTTPAGEGQDAPKK